MSRKAMEQAMDALEDMEAGQQKAIDAINALREALAACKGRLPPFGALEIAASPDRIARLLDALKAEQDEVYRLRAALAGLCEAADSTNYPLHGPSWDRLWNAAVDARKALDLCCLEDAEHDAARGAA
jgi:hypothetical protein